MSGFNRRDILRLGAAGCGLIASGHWLWQTAPAQAAELPNSSLSPDEVLQKLLAGNQRFMQHRLEYPDQSEARVMEVSQAQHPFVTILGCADSRAPAEIVFDQGIGDIFDVRLAGNIVTRESLGSIEYAVALLGTPLLMVLGHERCGAVTAAVQKEALPGDIGSFVEAILPAVDRVKNISGDPVENAVVANVGYQIERLQQSPLLTARVQSGQLKIVGARYDLDTGSVTLVS